MTTYQKENLRQATQTIKSLLLTKNTRMTQNYLINSGKLKCKSKGEPAIVLNILGQHQIQNVHTMFTPLK